MIDFKSSGKVALKMCFKHFGVVLTDEDVALYSQINHNYWELLVQGGIEKSTMLTRRFKDFVQKLSLDGIDCCWFNPKGKANQHSSIQIDYEIKMLKELFEIVG